MSALAWTLHEGDLPAALADRLSASPSALAVDTETTGLSLVRDRLLLVQLTPGDGMSHLVRVARDGRAPNLVRVLAGEQTKIMHFARFDMAVLYRTFGVMPEPVFCTKIAAKLVRTYSSRHGLRDLVREYCRVTLDKTAQSTDWAQETLSDEQCRYAVCDVAWLHALRDRLQFMLEREGRADLARSCFGFLPTRVTLDLAGWNETDIFAHQDGAGG